MTASLGGHFLSTSHFPLRNHRKPLSSHLPSAGSDEEYIYMNKVTVNKPQNAESQDKGTV